jgi:hypothetical protein
MVQEPEGSSPHSQQLANGPYPEPLESNPHPPANLFKSHSGSILSHLRPVLRLCQIIRPGPRLCVVFRNEYWVLRWGVVSPQHNPKLEDHPLSAVRDCLFYKFAAI